MIACGRGRIIAKEKDIDRLFTSTWMRCFARASLFAIAANARVPTRFLRFLKKAETRRCRPST